jgi:Ca-activated chloride channel family protein
MDIQFGNLQQLSWLWLVLVVVLVLAVTGIIQRRAIKQFATANLMPRLFPNNRAHRLVLKSFVTTAVMSLLVLALIDIRWGKTWREVPQKGIDVVFALDISRSMLAQDVAPNRLERAKQQIKDMVDEMAGDRVGLVVFAGDAKQQVPLTKHYHDFKNALDEVGTFNVDRGGSQLGNAIQLATDCFLDKTDDHKAIVVFTDGEDQESDPVNVAKKVHDEMGIRIFTVGLGDRQKGARVPIAGSPGSGSANQFLEYQGQQVWSKLNSSILEQVALETDGAYVPAETKSVDMADVYHKYVANVEQQDFETARINSYIPRYQIFVGLALALVLLEMFWQSGVKRTGDRHSGRTSFAGQPAHQLADSTSQTKANEQQKVAA